MRKADNPFEPGAGTRPPELVGRESMLEDAEAAIAKGTSGRPIRGQIYYGLRGVGKTVLLRAISGIAVKHNGLVVDLEAPEDKRLVELIAPAMRKLLIELSGAEKAKAILQQAAGVLQAFAAKFKVKIGDIGLEIKNPSGTADSGDLEMDLPELFLTVAGVAKRSNKIIILALDEMQYLSEIDLSALITAIHRVNQKSMPLGLFGAGLPQLLSKAGNAKSYSERLFQFTEIGALSEVDARRAVRDPIVSAKAEIRADALDVIFSKSQGYPYFLQEWGFRTWNEAKSSPISKDDVVAAEVKTIESLDKSFFRVRFDRLTQREKEYLRAMAELGPGPHRSGDVAKVMGKLATQTGTVRAKVIAKGMAYGGQYGIVNFSVPLFDEFMRREMPEFKAKASKRTNKARKAKA